MAYNDPPADRPARPPAGWSDPAAERDVRRGRHRARHADAAPDAYEDDGYGYSYGDGVSPQPMYGPDPSPYEPPGGPARRRRPPYPPSGRSAGGPPRPGGPWPLPGAPASRALTPGRRSPAESTDPYGWSGPGGRPGGPGMPPGGPGMPPGRPGMAPGHGSGHRGAPPPGPLGPGPGPYGMGPGSAYPSGSGPGSTGDKPPKTGRAGRNLRAAIGVGLLLVGIVLGSLFLWKPAFVAVLAAAACVGVWEMVGAFQASPRRRPATPFTANAAAVRGRGPDGRTGETTAIPV